MSSDETAFADRKKTAILIVDDEFLLAYDLAEEVESVGYDVVGPAHTVVSALDLIEAEHTDCAILDVNLGGETSYPIAEALAARGIPFIFITGYEAHQLQAEFCDASLLCKPVQGKSLHSKLQEMLNGRRQGKK